MSRPACLLSAMLMAILFRHSQGRFPMICARNVTEGTGVCCPVPNGFILPCGGPGRGQCGKLPDVQLNYYPRIDPIVMEEDDRFNWPHRYVQVGCRCEGNFYGHDCSSCKYGYTGADCSEREVYTRRNAATYTEDDKRTFVDTIMASKIALSGWGVLVTTADGPPDFVELTIWDLFQFSHYRTSHTIQDNGTCQRTNYNFAHSGPGFPTWHRMYLLWIERELRMVSPDKSFALPYWDWVGADHCAVCTNDFLGEVLPDGTIHSDSRLSTLRTICNSSTNCSCDPREDAGPLTRRLGRATSTTLPPISDAEYTLNTKIYDIFPFNRQAGNSSFRAVLEGGLDGGGMHNAVHDWIGGSMGNLLTAGNDPIFLLHHAFVDKMFEMWLRDNKPSANQFPSSFGPAGHLAQDPLVPFFPPEYNIDYFKSSSTFGYHYDTLKLPYEKGHGGRTKWEWWKYLALCGGGLLIVIICIILCCVCKRKNNVKKTNLRGIPKESDKGEKEPLLPQ